MTEITFEKQNPRSNIIKVWGVGGGGSNAVSYMFKQGIKDVDFVVCNTDAQALDQSPVPVKIQLGAKGLGAGSVPDVGRNETESTIEQIKEALDEETRMLFITAGMGGGTGTGGAPVIAKMARERGILTVGIVTMPFMFEGRRRRLLAENGINEIRKYVDTLLVINNEKLRELYGNLSLTQAFERADDVLTIAAKGIAEMITTSSKVNVDFEDIRTVMSNSGKAIMGSAIAEGENRAEEVIKIALSSPLLDDNSIKGADNVLLYISSGTDEIKMDEVTEITDYIQEEAGQNADILWGYGIDESLGDKISVTVVATGFDSKKTQCNEPQKIHVGSIDPKAAPAQPKESKPEKSVDTPEIKLRSPDNSPPIIKKETAAGFSFDLEQQIARVEKPKRPEPETPELFAKNTVQEPDVQKFTPVRKTAPMVAQEQNKLDDPEQRRVANDRISKLKEMSFKLRSSSGLAELEKQPAYVRKNYEPTTPDFNSSSQVSRFSLSGDEEKPDLRNNNTFLFDEKPD
jgi:cell division protein FtsZ